MNKERILEIFEDLLLIYSPSKNEKEVALYIIDFLKKLGLEIYLDESYDTYGGNCPTIFAKLKGNIKGQGVSLSAHIDVVEPNKGLKIIKEDKIWKSDGTTTLGGDDKGGVAPILYIIEHLVENKLDHENVFVIITPGEEAGMLGAKNINWERVYENFNPSKNMIVLDNAGKSNKVAYQAPTCYHFNVEVLGRKAHAGIEPEKGINAIYKAALAISKLNIGRISQFITSNISVIESNFPTNVVPDSCRFIGEVRAHSDEDARGVLDEYKNILKETLGDDFKFNETCEYPPLKSKDNLKFVNDFLSVYKSMGVEAEAQIIGGGSDANFFANEGFNSIIIGVGMQKVHTTDEYIELDEMFIATKALLKYIVK